MNYQRITVYALLILGYGGGFNERENVEYIEREESDGEYDEVISYALVCRLNTNQKNMLESILSAKENINVSYFCKYTLNLTKTCFRKS